MVLGEMRKQVWGPEIMEEVGFSQWSPHLSGPPALGLLCMAAQAVHCTTWGPWLQTIWWMTPQELCSVVAQVTPPKLAA